MIKLGVIGLGHMGGYHASVCATLPHVRLVGVADHSEKMLEKVKSNDVIKSQDYHTWIDQVDGVIIAVPTDYHYEVTKDCLMRGKHVLLEKPITKTIQEAVELFSLAKQFNVALHVGHVERFNGAVQEIKKIIDKPYLIECHRMGPFTNRVQRDSVVLDLMIHDIDIVLNLIDAPVAKINQHVTNVYTDRGDIATVQIIFENGVIANIVSSRASQVKRRSMTIHQKDAFISLDFTTQDISVHRRASTSVDVSADQLKYKQESLVEHLFVYKDNPLKLEIEYFIQAIKTALNLYNPEKDLRSLQITFDIEQQLGLR